MKQLTPHNAEQHRIAQQAGNEAYDNELDNRHGDERQCYDAYCSAYDASLAEQQAAPTTPGWFVNPAVTLEEIAEMRLRCDETATEAPSYDGMWM